MKPTAVSIILPIYNGGRYLLSALATVQAQTLAEWELIVVDDGSTDNTASLLAQAPADPRRIVIHQPNSGRSGSRKRALAAAHGELIAFLDVDDAWHPEFLSQLAAALQAVPHAVAAFCGWQYMDELGHPLPQSVLLSERDLQQFGRDLRWRNSIMPSSIAARRPAIEQVGGFDDSLHGSEDWDLWLRLKSLGAFVPVPRVLTWYRTHPDSATEDVAVAERERLKVNAKHLGSLDEPLASWPAVRRQAVGFTYFNAALAYLWQTKTVLGEQKLRQAVECWPGLLDLDEFYYELGCARQPRGLRGTAKGLDLKTGEALIRAALLDRTASLTARSAQRYWGHACLVLARLARNTGNWSACRGYALRAMRYGTVRDKRVAARLLARSVVPGALLHAVHSPDSLPMTPP